MKRLFFILGRYPTLSIAEIQSVLNVFNTSYHIECISRETVVIKVNDSINESELMSKLGGAIKIGRVLEEIKLNTKMDCFDDIISSSFLQNLRLSAESKVHFGISIYDGGADKILFTSIVYKLKDLYISVKEKLKKQGFRPGFVRIQSRTLSSVSVEKNRLLDQGIELVLIITDTSICIGRTIEVQEYESFTIRDIKRPKKDKRSGILPPKLARMMINLAEKSTQSTILDPFCGSGTIVQEAVILGFRNIYGSDISKKAVDDTKENIHWLFNNYSHLQLASYHIQIDQKDAQRLARLYPENFIDAIVTEPYLSPPLLRNPNQNLINNIFRTLAPLYINTLHACAYILKPGGRIIIVFPVFEIFSQKFFFEILEEIKISALKIVKPLQDIKNLPFYEITLRDTMLYGGNDQFVKREIVVLEKKV